MSLFTLQGLLPCFGLYRGHNSLQALELLPWCSQHIRDQLHKFFRFFTTIKFSDIYLRNSQGRNWPGIPLLGMVETFHHSSTLTAKTKYSKFETNIPRKGIAGSQSQFPHSCVIERFMYSHNRSASSAGGNMWSFVDQSWDYIDRSQTHECENWDWGRAIPRKGNHK